MVGMAAAAGGRAGGRLRGGPAGAVSRREDSTGDSKVGEKRASFDWEEAGSV